jgi:SAM-dependent methyltransferase
VAIAHCTPNGAEGGRWLDWQRRRHHSRDDYAEYQFQSARGRLTTVSRRFGLTAPRVLDVGCGLGGMAVAYALEGADVTAVDVQLYDPETIAFAERFACARGAHVTFLAASESAWPLGDERFDLVFLDSVLEHAEDPGRLLAQSARVLRHRGAMLVSFPVFYGPYGGHIDDYVRWPWFHLLPRPVVLRTLRRCRARGGYVTPELVAGTYLSLNRLTLRRFTRLLRGMPLEVVELGRTAYLTTAGNQLVFDVRAAARRSDWPAVRRAFRRIPADFTASGLVGFLLLLATLPLTKIPLVEEAFLGGVRATLRKVPERAR